MLEFCLQHQNFFFHRTEVCNLKEGEEEKTKSYVALCLVKNGYDPIILDKLKSQQNLVINQMTPLRVLHRRPLAVRPRTIHSVSASATDEHFFKVSSFVPIEYSTSKSSENCSITLSYIKI